MLFSRKGAPKGASERNGGTRAKRVSQSLSNARKRISQSIKVKLPGSPKPEEKPAELTFDSMYGGESASDAFQETCPEPLSPNSESSNWFYEQYDKARENALKQVLEEDESLSGGVSSVQSQSYLDTADQYAESSGEDILKRTSAIRKEN